MFQYMGYSENYFYKIFLYQVEKFRPQFLAIRPFQCLKDIHDKFFEIPSEIECELNCLDINQLFN